MKYNLCLVWAWVLVVTSLENAATSSKNTLRGTRWWTLAKDMELPPSQLQTNDIHQIPESFVSLTDKSLQLLSKKQRKLVTTKLGSIVAVAQGAQMAVRECQHQFLNHPWNCPVKETSHGSSMFGKILNIGCRETAFIYAITSAGVTYSVARACRDGHIFNCSCDVRADKPSGQTWKWGGCSDNIKEGYQFSREFIDSVERGQDLRFMVNKQNNEAGRRHVLSGLKQQCKCHGTSGSCAINTCWMTLPSFRWVGDRLKEKFDGASKVIADNSWTDNRTKKQRSHHSTADNTVGKSGMSRLNFTPVDSSHKVPTRTDMVYFENSPDFCTPDPKLALDGTRGRECNATSQGIDGCDLMCCGRGYQAHTLTLLERCSCTFQWCCEVKCQHCTRLKLKNICD